MFKFFKKINIMTIFLLTIIFTTACTNNWVDMDIKSDSPNSETYIDIKCDSPDVKALVINSFTKNNEYYKSIDESSIGDIILMYPRAVDYNKDINVYNCAGDIVIKAVESSFSPKDFNSSNLYYSYITYFYNAMKQGTNVARYDTFTADAEYKTQISEGELLVISRFGNENLSCEDACKQANMREQVQKNLKREAEQQKNEHVILPD